MEVQQLRKEGNVLILDEPNPVKTELVKKEKAKKHKKTIKMEVNVNENIDESRVLNDGDSRQD